MLRVYLTCFGVLIAGAGGAFAQSLVERGSYLVNGILSCGNCHTPKGPGGVEVRTQLHSGGSQVWDTPTYRVKGSNITPDRDTGIGAWTDAEIKRAITDGVRPTGVPLAPIMPFAFNKALAPSDLDSVVAYLRSVPPIKNEVEIPNYKAPMHVEPFPGAEQRVTEAEQRDPVKRGFYLATVGHCMECHTPEANGRHDFKTSLGKGGQEFRGPWGVTFARNITSHPTAGIGAWSDAEIKRAIKDGIRKDGTRLRPPMGFAWYARMTEADLNAVVAYLRTVPPLE